MNSVCTRAVGRCTVGGTHAPSGVMGGAYRRCRWDARDARGVWAVAVPRPRDELRVLWGSTAFRIRSGENMRRRNERSSDHAAASRLACPGPQVEGHKTEQESRYVDRSIRARL